MVQAITITSQSHQLLPRKGFFPQSPVLLPTGEGFNIGIIGSLLPMQSVWYHFAYNAIRLRINNPNPLSPNLNFNPNPNPTCNSQAK